MKIPSHFQTPKSGKLKKVAPGVAHILWEDSLGKKYSEANFLLRRRELDKSIFQVLLSKNIFFKILAIQFYNLEKSGARILLHPAAPFPP